MSLSDFGRRMNWEVVSFQLLEEFVKHWYCSLNVWYNWLMMPSGPGVFIERICWITDSISCSRFSLIFCSWDFFSVICISHTFSISYKFPDLLAQSCFSHSLMVLLICVGSNNDVPFYIPDFVSLCLCSWSV